MRQNDNAPGGLAPAEGINYRNPCANCRLASVGNQAAEHRRRIAAAMSRYAARQPGSPKSPRLTDAEAVTLRKILDRFESFAEFTGDRRAADVVEGLVNALIEGGRLP